MSEVELSQRSINSLTSAVADAVADAIAGTARSSTTGGVGPSPGPTNRARSAPDLTANLFKSLDKFGDGLGRTFDQMDRGGTGLSTFNSAIQGGADGLTKLLGNNTILATALGKVGVSMSAYAQQVNQLVDVQYDTYQTLSKVGGADQLSGLTGVMDTFNKFGYASKADFPKLTALIQENAGAFATLGGTVESGMKQFGNVAAILQKTGTQTELLLMGMKPDEINKSFAALIKSTTMTGGSINNLGKTEEERAKSVKEYIKQQDIITRLTGLTADAQQKAYEQSLANDRYAVRAAQQQMELTDAQASGDKKRIEAAEAAIAADKAKIAWASTQGPDVLAGMQDTLAGAVTEASQKLRQSYGEGFVAAAQTVPTTIKEGQELFVQMAMAAKENSAEFIKSFGDNIKLSGVNIGVSVQAMMKSMASTLTPDALQKAYEEANKTTGIPKPVDAALGNAVAVKQETDKLMSGFENFVNAGVKPISDAMVEAARDMRKTVETLLPGSIPKYLEQTKVQGQTLREKMTNEQGANAPSAKRGTEQWVEDFRTTANEAITAVGEKTKEAANGLATSAGGFLDSIKEFGENIPNAARDAARQIREGAEKLRDAVNGLGRSGSPVSSPISQIGINPSILASLNSQDQSMDVKSSILAFLRSQDQVRPTTASGTNLNFSNMARLLTDYRNSAGPNGDYRASLVDATYRADTEDTDSKYAAANSALANIGTVSDVSREQMAAYATMIQQQGELIDLLQRSVGIQDKTLRATYNA
jgi:hypothetical protein